MGARVRRNICASFSGDGERAQAEKHACCKHAQHLSMAPQAGDARIAASNDKAKRRREGGEHMPAGSVPVI